MDKKDLVVLIGEKNTGIVGGNYKFCINEFPDAVKCLSPGPVLYTYGFSALDSGAFDLNISGETFVVTDKTTQKNYDGSIGSNVELILDEQSPHPTEFLIGVYNRRNVKELEEMARIVREKQREISEAWGKYQGSQ